MAQVRSVEIEHYSVRKTFRLNLFGGPSVSLMAEVSLKESEKTIQSELLRKERWKV